MSAVKSPRLSHGSKDSPLDEFIKNATHFFVQAQKFLEQVGVIDKKASSVSGSTSSSSLGKASPRPTTMGMQNKID